jgi:hypothetical protein
MERLELEKKFKLALNFCPGTFKKCSNKKNISAERQNLKFNKISKKTTFYETKIH